MPQSLVQIYVHLVFSTKHRQPFLLDVNFRSRAHAYLVGICSNFGSPSLITERVAEDELRRVCAKYGLAIDERYVWDQGERVVGLVRVRDYATLEFTQGARVRDPGLWGTTPSELKAHRSGVYPGCASTRPWALGYNSFGVDILSIERLPRMREYATLGFGVQLFRS